VEAGFRTKSRTYKEAKSFSDSAELEKNLMRESRKNKAAAAAAARQPVWTLSMPA
jgi:hypothetical protein